MSNKYNDAKELFTKILVKRNYLLETAHEMARGLYDADIIDKREMQKYDKLCGLTTDYKEEK